MESDPERPRKRLLVLGAGPAQLGLLVAARERGDLFVIAADRDPSAPGLRYADRRAIVSTEDEPGVHRLAEAERVDGLIAPGTDWPLGIAARVASRLRLPHPLAPETAVLAISKLRQRERFAERGVPQPRWRVLAEPDGDVGFPCVVKAPDRQGQRGLSFVESPADLGAAIAEAVAASRGGTCIVEELVPGSEITVNAFSSGGRFVPLTVTDRLTAEPPAFGVALAHVWPSEFADRRAVEVARRAAEALGVRDGPTYTQLRMGASGPQVVELAARLGGGHDAELCRAALGVDLNGLALAAALGERTDEPRPTELVGGACVRFLVAPPGELRGVRGVEEAARLDGVLGVDVYRRPGHRFRRLLTGSDRAGAILAVGSSRGEALERAGRAAELVRLDTAAEAVA